MKCQQDDLHVLNMNSIKTIDHIIQLVCTGCWCSAALSPCLSISHTHIAQDVSIAHKDHILVILIANVLLRLLHEAQALFMLMKALITLPPWDDM